MVSKGLSLTWPFVAFHKRELNHGHIRMAPSVAPQSPFPYQVQRQLHTCHQSCSGAGDTEEATIRLTHPKQEPTN